MVERRITDGKRIAELLASELDGLAVGPLAEVGVVDAEPDVAPSDGGSYAYAIEHSGERIGEVYVRPEGAVLRFEEGWAVQKLPDQVGLSLEEDKLNIRRGASVKGVVDGLRYRLDQ